ncbi:Retinoblastoma-related protein [Drosera capensis]
MEDLRNSAAGSENRGDLEARFDDLCKNQLSLEEKSLSETKKLLLDSKNILTSTLAIGCNTVEELEHHLFAFVLYSVMKLSDRAVGEESQGADNNGVTLCQILRAVKLNLVDFFQELPQFVIKVGPSLRNMYGSDWEKRLEAKELQTNFVHLRILSQYFKCAYRLFFKTSEAGDQSTDTSASSSGYLSDYHRFGWLLFLTLRSHAFRRFKDLVTSTNSLVSVLAILIIHVPCRLRDFAIEDSAGFVRSKRGVNLVASLSAKYDTSEDEVKKMMEKANDLIANTLKKAPCSALENKAENLLKIDPEGLVYFENLFDDSNLSTSISILEKEYDDVIRNKGDIDGRVVVDEDDKLLGPDSISGAAVSSVGAKRMTDGLLSPTKTISTPATCNSPSSHSNGTPVRTKAAATPVTTAMTTAKWLRTVISPLPSTLSAQLEKIFSSFDKSITNDVIRRAQIILEAIFPNSALGECCATGNIPNADLMDNIWAQQRRTEALKLYYKVLEAIFTAEAQSSQGNNLAPLLTNERFHRCMLACSSELVLATRKTATMLFPTVLEKIGITAFDLSKVIETFVRHEGSLPRELRRHLNSLEERLLDSMVWEKGSSVYNSLVIARPALSAEISRLGLLAEPMPSLDAIALSTNFSSRGLPPLPVSKKRDALEGQNGDIRSPKRLCTEYRSALVECNSFTSPVKDRSSGLNNFRVKMTPPPALQSVFASPTQPSLKGEGETCAETGINVLFSKISKLAAVRINGMIERLQATQQMRESVYHLFQQILNQRMTLFFNRHIDQIILCCFYIVAKISKLNLTFKEIIMNYKKQPQYRPDVIHCVFVDGSRRNKKAAHDHVGIIQFYNEEFIPAVRQLLLGLGPIGANSSTIRSPESKGTDAAQCPASPKLAPFPSLPDMSPKKVSATHNVYVSPLRSSKMDALIWHSPKSYYACVGESTHAYQSPSKDLSAINDRLNSPRRVRGKLNFDNADPGLVSDSLVANSLQDGVSTIQPVKSEEPSS